VFDAPSRAFLEQWGPAGCALALDLGCGPGFSTELLRDALAPQRVVGVEASPAFVQAARRRAPGLEWVQHDVLELPFPTGPADLVYARFLVSHLPDPARALRALRNCARTPQTDPLTRHPAVRNRTALALPTVVRNSACDSASQSAKTGQTGRGWRCCLVRHREC